MKQIDKTEIKSALVILRNQLELYAKTHGHNYTSLRCLCGVSSYLVFLKLKELGYQPIFYMNENHCFTMINGYYIDLTIKQFNNFLQYGNNFYRRKF